MKKLISIIIPVFCEEQNIVPLFKRIKKVIYKIRNYEWEIIYVNDGSTDNTFSVLKKLSKENKNMLKILDLSKNFGKEIALTAGVNNALESNAIICIDADLQHPPEIIPLLVKKWEKGADVVITIRKSTDNKALIREVGSNLFYWLMNRFSGVNMVSKTTDFRIIDRKVSLVFSTITERQRMFRGIIDWMGFKQDFVEFEAKDRIHGEARYSYKDLLKLAINSITSFSLWPLRITGYLGIIITIFSGFLTLRMVLSYFINNENIYTPIAMVLIANTFLIGIVLMAIGLVALYIGRIHTEVINRPLFIVREKINFKD